MKLALMGAPAAATRKQRIERGAQFLRTQVLPYNPDLTWAELDQILKSGKMNGFLSDIGGAINSGIRDAAGAVGFRSTGTSVTDFLDSAGHSLEDKLSADVEGDAKSSILDALGSFGQDIRTGHVINSLFTPVGIGIILVVVYFLFIRKGKR